MKDIIIAFLGSIIIGLLVSKENIIENWGNLPSFNVQVQKAVELECENDDENRYKGPIVAAPPNLQNMLAPRAMNVSYGANILYNLPPTSMQAADSRNPLTYGATSSANPPPGTFPVAANMGVSQCPTCAPCSSSKEGFVQGMHHHNYQHQHNRQNIRENFTRGDIKENLDDEPYEAISSSASQAKKMEKIQAMADNGMVLSRNQPNMTVDTDNGPCNVVVYDRLVYSNSKSKLYGLGDPIRGDVGCIVPIQDQWFRPSVRPNIDLRPGAMTIMGGIDNETPRELRALQDIYSAGTSSQTTDAYAYSVNPSLAQKSISISGETSTPMDVTVSAFP